MVLFGVGGLTLTLAGYKGAMAAFVAPFAVLCAVYFFDNRATLGWLPLVAVAIMIAMIVLYSRFYARQLRDFAALSSHNSALVRTLVQINGELETALRAAERLAHYDGLTGLPNRRCFEKQVRRIDDEGVAQRHLLLADIDRFKSINDRFGHAVGDKVLARVGRLLEAATRDFEGMIAARVGGEEFAIVLTGREDAEAERLADRIRARFADASFATGDGMVDVTSSMGIARWVAGEDVYDAMGRADVSLYAAKDAGRGRLEWVAAASSAA